MSNGSWVLHPHADVAVAVPARDRGARLGVARVDVLRREAVLVDSIGLREARREVAGAHRGTAGDVALAVEHRQRLVVAPAAMDQRRAGRSASSGRIPRATARTRSRSRAPPPRRSQAGRGDRGDRLAAETHDHPSRRHGPVLDCRAETDLRDVLGRQDAAHARQRQRFGDIQPHDAGMRLAAAQDLAEQHARQREVGGIDMLAGDLADAVDAVQPLAGDAAFAGCS